MDDTAAAIAEQPSEAPDTRAQIALIRLSRIERSTTNPRKTFNEAQLAELTESVRQHGILQPLLVRPVVGSEDRYELIAGERRYRAAMAAELREVPALVRVMSDLQVLEVQLVENLQRADLHELEEAEGYERLLQSHGYTIDDLRAKVGKSRSYVFQRLKLLDLCEVVRKAFFGGKLTFTTALLIARIPGEDLQKKAFTEITQGWQGQMTSRAAADHIQRNYMLRLVEAPFPRHDAGLVPSAGACGDCPKRTGNSPDLFADVTATDTCTDPSCFQSKVDAHKARMIERARERGVEVVVGKKAARMGTDYVALDEKDYQLTGTGKPLKQLLGKDAPAPVLVEDHRGNLVEALPKKVAVEALREKGHRVGDSRSADELKRERDHKIETTFRRRVFDAVIPRIAERQLYDLHPIVQAMWASASSDDRRRFLALKGWGEAEFADRTTAMSQEERYYLLHELALVPQLHVSSWSIGKAERLLAMAEDLEVDHAAIRKAVQAEMRAAEKAKAAKKAPKGDAPKPAPRGGKKAPKAAPAEGKEAAAKPAPRRAKKMTPTAAKPEEKPEVETAVPAVYVVGDKVQVAAELPGRTKQFVEKFAGRTGVARIVFVDNRVSVVFHDRRPGKLAWFHARELTKVDPLAIVAAPVEASAVEPTTEQLPGEEA